jgi:hypothetical protein
MPRLYILSSEFILFGVFVQKYAPTVFYVLVYFPLNGKVMLTRSRHCLSVSSVNKF